ncbi:acyltransferase [Pseudomonas moraviensis subsp. stanleyae]|uniref:acyltransferase family protein n=1 Tax=Pseudomonas moraviensis TaxID=321662 RepID=UPI002E32EC7B|nr:acyltransferase family protein [Pseudomonas moraviensis]MED7666787.1 acyltransferase [Pseudomonas moraviensis subsp. stanleyae]
MSEFPNSEITVKCHAFGCSVTRAGRQEPFKQQKATDIMTKNNVRVAADFLSDINGLRAIAVLSVVLFHFKVTGFDGGYVGVDIFFVISGFLMTKIILGKIQRDQFSVVDFLGARLLRIYPPMLVLSIAAVVAGYFFLTPHDYNVLAGRIVYAVASLSNIRFYTDSLDYFAADQSSNWLLHLWSLAVEVQFYLIFPLLLYLARSRRIALSLLMTLFSVSFALCIWLTPDNQPAAFFLLPTRVWEFVAGGLAFLGGSYISSRIGKILSAGGLVLIAASIFFFRESMMFPGWLAIIPVLGTAMVIAAQRESKLLSNRFVQFFGTISYSLYLWHWPVWVGARQYRLEAGPQTTLLLLCISIVLALLSYNFVERPLNNLRHNQRRQRGNVLAASVAAGLLAITSWGVIAKAGFPSRVPELISEVGPRFRVDIKQKPRDGVCFLTLGEGPELYKDKCFTTVIDESQTMMFVWGDSFAAHIWFGLSASSSYIGVPLLGATSAGCLPLLNAPSKFNSNCALNNQRALAEIKRIKPNTVILFARWPDAEQSGVDVVGGIRNTVDYLAAEGVGAVVVGPNIEWAPNLPQRLTQESFARGGVVPERLTDPFQFVVKSLDDRMRKSLIGSGARYISLYELLCSDAGCKTVVTVDGREELTVYDFGHLTVIGAEAIVQAVHSELIPKKMVSMRAVNESR